MGAESYNIFSLATSTFLEIYLQHPTSCIPVVHSFVYGVHQTLPFFVEVGVACETKCD